MTPVATPHFRLRRWRPAAGPSASFRPAAVAALYQFPPHDGSGQVVGVIELGGAFSATDLKRFCGANPVPSVTVVPVAGGGPSPDPGGADVEVMLDVCVIADAAPGAAQRVYFAPNTNDGFAAAIRAARLDGCTVVSISWGGPEDQWPASAIQQMDAEIKACRDAGIPVFVAAGDNGSSDGEGRGDHVDFPAASPWSVSCGGTALVAHGGSIQSETVWNDGSTGGATGGGVSVVESRPAFQASVGVPGNGRGVPDLAGNADPATGYEIVTGGQVQVVGGTSAVAPLMAALCCRLKAAGVSFAGGWNEAVYPLLGTAAWRDVLVGNNGTYAAQAGYDCCTGPGVPVGTALLAALAGTGTGGGNPPPPPPPPPPPAGTVTVAQVQAAFAQAEAAVRSFNRTAIKYAEQEVMPIVQQMAGQSP